VSLFWAGFIIGALAGGAYIGRRADREMDGMLDQMLALIKERAKLYDRLR